MFLRCNNKFCFEKLTDVSFITICSHAFCYKCICLILRTKRCLMCRLNIRRHDISETTTYLSKQNIYGKNPISILEIAVKAIEHYMKNKEYEIQVFSQELRTLRRQFENKVKEIVSLQDVHTIEKKLLENKIVSLENELRNHTEKKLYHEITTSEVKIMNENHNNGKRRRVMNHCEDLSSSSDI
ncbi:hypothetical protein CDIK_0817 [Cucumispora dikerogammari]|nr:hypothetical protein CDIK_0817 [Cucumispora dikerogammari]